MCAHAGFAHLWADPRGSYRSHGCRSPPAVRRVVARHARRPPRRPAPAATDAADPRRALHAAQRARRHPARGPPPAPPSSSNLLFRVGSKDEPPGRTGFAHLFEHLMFMGTKNVPNGKFDAIMEAAGGYEQRVDQRGPHQLLRERPVEPARDLLVARGRSPGVAARRHDQGEGRPAARRGQERAPPELREPALRHAPSWRCPSTLYPADHPYHHPVIGSHEDLDRRQRRRRQGVLPPVLRAVERVAGDRAATSRRRTRAGSSRNTSGGCRSGRCRRTRRRSRRRWRKPARVTLTDAVQLPRVVLAWHSPAALRRRRRRVRSARGGARRRQVVAALSGAGLREEAGRVGRGRAARRRATARSFVITATAQSGHTAAELEQAIDAELARARQATPPTESELERARAFVQTSCCTSIEAPVQHGRRAQPTSSCASATPRELAKRYLGALRRGRRRRRWRRGRKKVLDAPRVTVRRRAGGGK